MNKIKNIHQFYDKAYKKLFSHKRMVEDFLKGFVKEEFAKDIEVLELVNTDFITKSYKNFRSDLVFKAQLKQKSCYIFLLFEFKTIDEKVLSLKMLNYIVLFYLSLLKNEKYKLPLPPIFPVVIYIGNQESQSSESIRDIINIPYKSLEKYIPDFRYFMFDINKISKKAITRLAIYSKNISSLLFEIDKYDENKLSEEINNIAELLRENAPLELVEDFQDYLLSIFSENEKEKIEIIKNINKEPTMLYHTVKKWRENIRNEGKMEGKLEGKRELKIEIAKNMLKKGMDKKTIIEITGLKKRELSAL
jgi:predicted transposase/invertase (TIGR01784 family)